MFLAAKYNGTELPIYDPQEIELRSPRLVPLLDLESSSFLRAVRVMAGRRLLRQGIEPLLQKADQEFDSLANGCNTDVIGHQWGLYPLTSLSDRMRYQIYLPKDPHELRIPLHHLVVANVEVLRNPLSINPYSSTGLRINEGLRTYKKAPNTHRPYDIDVDQFASGVTDNEIALGATPVKPKLLDIEPRLE